MQYSIVIQETFSAVSGELSCLRVVNHVHDPVASDAEEMLGHILKKVLTTTCRTYSWPTEFITRLRCSFLLPIGTMKRFPWTKDMGGITCSGCGFSKTEWRTESGTEPAIRAYRHEMVTSYGLVPRKELSQSTQGLEFGKCMSRVKGNHFSPKCTLTPIGLLHWAPKSYSYHHVH